MDHVQRTIKIETAVIQEQRLEMGPPVMLVWLRGTE